MKLALMTFAFVLNTHAALACTNPEAQYTGVVTDVVNCTFKIKFKTYNPSMTCGLDIEEAVATTFNDVSCSLKEKDQVAGYLVIKDGLVVID